MAKSCIVAVLFFSFSFLFADCEFMSMISRVGHSISWENDIGDPSDTNPIDPYE